jgi:hypothetical protein
MKFIQVLASKQLIGDAIKEAEKQFRGLCRSYISCFGLTAAILLTAVECGMPHRVSFKCSAIADQVEEQEDMDGSYVLASCLPHGECNVLIAFALLYLYYTKII